MPFLAWNDSDFAACLEVLPETDEYGISYTYCVDRDGLRLTVTVFPYDSDIYLDLFREGVANALFEMKLTDCSGTRYVSDSRGEYLEFAPSKVFGSRYDRTSPIPYGIRLSVNPCISIRLFTT